MRRLALGGLVAVAVWLALASVAWGNSLTATCGSSNTPCDQSGSWYRGPVQVMWQVSPAPTKVVGCNSQLYGDAMTTVSCQVWWGPNGTIPTQQIVFPLNVEASSPTATAAPSRPPDSGGWYNHPVTAAVSAAAFSGIASCTPTTYSGPSSMSASVSATCVDDAGKSVTVASSPFAYDITPPSLTATATTGDRSVTLSWQAGGDVAPVAAFAVTRSPGAGHAAADMIYDGTSSGFQDTNVQDGVAYTYTVTAVDQAGNTSTQTVTATPQAHLIAPVNTAHLAGPPLLSWTPVRGATYYNVQLYRDGKKILSAWPTEAQLQLRRTWRYDGRHYKLKPGRYRWFVWPGLGKRRAAHYGHMVGSWTFVVAR